MVRVIIYVMDNDVFALYFLLCSKNADWSLSNAAQVTKQLPQNRRSAVPHSLSRLLPTALALQCLETTRDVA